MTFAKRPNEDLERPYRSNLIDLTVLPDAQLRRRRLMGRIGVPVFVAMFVIGCIGLASDPRTIGQLVLVAGAMTLGLVMAFMLVGSLIRIRKELATRAWVRTLESADDSGRMEWPEQE